MELQLPLMPRRRPPTTFSAVPRMIWGSFPSPQSVTSATSPVVIVRMLRNCQLNIAQILNREDLLHHSLVCGIWTILSENSLHCSLNQMVGPKCLLSCDKSEAVAVVMSADSWLRSQFVPAVHTCSNGPTETWPG